MTDRSDVIANRKSNVAAPGQSGLIKALNEDRPIDQWTLFLHAYVIGRAIIS